jgi:Outer membrane protein beta-barrel domain
MPRSLRLLLAAAALNATLGAAIVSAQTVMVRNGPASSAVEVALNGAKVGGGTTNEAGEATIPLSVGGAVPATGIDANVYVDYCDKLRRVQIVERTKLVPAAEPGCDRHEVSGLFWVRPVNTIVFDLAGPSPSLLLVRGTYVYRAPKEDDAPRIWRPLPTGLLVFGGVGLAKLDTAFETTCGNATPCSGNNEGLGGYTFGATYWIKRWAGIEGSYVKPRQITAQGGDTFTFNSKQDTDVFSIMGKGGIPAGPVRFFGEGGMSWHESTLTTNERIDLTSQTFTLKTQGWAYVWGGGVEAWIWKKIALYGDLGVIRVKGDAINGGEAKIDDHIRFLFIGAKFRLTPK